MHPSDPRSRLFALLLGLVAIVSSAEALADPPSRVARLGYISGTASLSPAGEDDWVQATLNRPLVTGDRLWSDADGRTELQLGTAAVRMAPSTSVSLLNIDDRIVQLDLSQGALNVRVRRLAAGETFEIDTPNLAFSIRKPGEYRIDVDPAGGASTVVVRSGQADVFGGEGAAYVVNARQSYQFSGTGLREYERLEVASLDEFDHWCSDRDRRVEKSASARHVSPYVIGYQDLDGYGTWRTVSGYGNVWVPTRVAADWAPYRDGHWTWIEPWGWTWVDDAPWGFAVSHYGRWVHRNGVWCWVPGPVAARPVYAPALVAFVGGANFQLSISSGNVGGVAWFPLGPREVYRPAYAVSRRYFNDVNVTNTVINTTVINNYYDNPNAAHAAYVNRRVPNAVVAVPATAFAQAQPVGRAAVRVPRERLETGPVSSVAAVRPTRASLIGDRKPGGRPPAAVLERPIVARTAPPPRPAAFERREQLLAKNPGRPLDAAAMKDLTPTARAQRDRIQLVKPARTEPPTAVPPPQLARAETRGKGERRAPPVSAIGQAPATAPVPGVPPAQADQRGRGRERPGQQVAQPQATASAPPGVQPLPDSRKPEQQAKGKDRFQPFGPAPRPAESATAVGQSPPTVAPGRMASQEQPPLAKPGKRERPAVPDASPRPNRDATVASAPPSTNAAVTPKPAPVPQEPRGKAERERRGGGQPAAVQPSAASAPPAAPPAAAAAPQVHRSAPRAKPEHRAPAPAPEQQAVRASPRKHAEPRSAPVVDAAPPAAPKQAEPRHARVANAPPPQAPKKHVEPRPAPIASAAPPPQMHAQSGGHEPKPEGGKHTGKVPGEQKPEGDKKRGK